MKRLFSITILGVALASGIWSQDIRGHLAAPFVSHLNAESNENEVVLTWRDAPGSDGDVVYQIRRYHQSIDSSNLDLSNIIAVVAPDIRTYTDRPEPGIDWWYAVVTVLDGEPLNILIPWRNSLGSSVIVRASAQEIRNAAKVLTLDADMKDSSVSLRYTADSRDREIMILRSPSDFDEAGSIDLAVVAGSGTEMTGEVTDEPLPGLTWYYAALDKALLSAGTDDWRDFAAFSGPTVIPVAGASETAMTSMRPAPLPLLRITRSTRDGRPIPDMDGEIPSRLPMSSESVQALAKVLGPMEGRIWEAPKTDILAADQGNSENRRQQLLKEILVGKFSEGEWGVADAELFALSATNGMDDATKARIQYYRGQCAYFMNDLSSAFLSFLSASDYYYPQSRVWMLRIYRDITPVG
jgi:hypothetical protein